MAMLESILLPFETVRELPQEWGIAKLLNVKLENNLPFPGRFLHPDVQVGNSPHRGRHFKATKTIPAGELLLLDSPLVLAASQEALVTLASEKAISDAGFQRELLSLSGGIGPNDGMMRARAADAGVVPRQLLESIVKHNFHELEQPSVDGKAPESPPRCGLWPLACIANHSLRPNIVRFFAGDVLYMRLSKEARAGEELLDNYIDPRQPLQERHAFLARVHDISDEGPDEFDAPEPILQELQAGCEKAQRLLEACRLEAAM